MEEIVGILDLEEQRQLNRLLKKIQPRTFCHGFLSPDKGQRSITHDADYSSSIFARFVIRHRLFFSVFPLVVTLFFSIPERFNHSHQRPGLYSSKASLC